ncbi:MAG TPA: hypothetical protein PKE45_13445 [Caldilineaceae bacterium]|nr:hypothetical protein [Caldilineaceae bacterium]
MVWPDDGVGQIGAHLIAKEIAVTTPVDHLKGDLPLAQDPQSIAQHRQRARAGREFGWQVGVQHGWLFFLLCDHPAEMSIDDRDCSTTDCSF